nr:retrovirus-related Pol polyprotein from transposon TNT 1-94 [Tanacetum cinerariifolium]
MVASQRKQEGQWTADERKATNLDQCFKSLIMSVLPDDQMNSVINCLTSKSTWDDLILYHEGPSDDFQDSPDDEEDTRSSHGYLNDLEEQYQARAFLTKSKRFFKKGTQSSPQDKPELSPTKDFEAKYNKVKAKLTLLSLSALASKALMVKIKDPVFIKSLDDDTKVFIPDVERPWLSKAEGFIMTNHDTSRILPVESQRNTTNPLVTVTEFLATKYDSEDESSVCSTPLPPLKKLNGVEPTFGPKTIKSNLRSKSTFKAETLKGAIINKPFSAPDKGNKNSSASVVNSAPAGKLKSVKIKDDPPLANVIKELNNLKLQFSKNQSSYSKILFCKRCKKTDHRTCDHAEYISTMNMSQHLKSVGRASSRSKIPRPSKCFFPPCKHYGYIDHLSNECLYYLICGLCGSYDHDLNGHNRIISLEREINLRNPQHTFKRGEVCGSSTHTTTDHYDIEWFKRGETFQAKKTEALKSTKDESSNTNRSKTPTKSRCSRHMTGVKSYLHKYMEQPRPKVVFGDDSTCTTEGYGSIKCNGKCDEKANDGYLLGYSLVSKAFRVFNTRRQQTKETYHITFNEIHDAIKFSKPSIDNINIAENKRYLPDEYLHPYEPSQRHQTNSNDMSFIEPYEYPPLLIPSVFTPAPQDRWSQDKHIELVNIIGNPRAGMLTRAMAKQLSAASAHECLFIDFLSEEEPKKVSEALKHHGWVDAM